MTAHEVIYQLEERFITQEKERVKRVSGKSPGMIKIESANKVIDRLVYELYGLSEDEIKIVENKE